MELINSQKVLENLVLSLPRVSKEHAPKSELYALLKSAALQASADLFGKSGEAGEKTFLPFGKLNFPYYAMGAIDTVDLFGIDEIIIFSFYWANRNRYKKTLDIGANLGLHSIMMSRCGFQVECFEPDPTHFKLLNERLDLNQASSVKPHQAAVSTHEGEAEFVRVLGNTTGSHLAGAKANPYGDLEKFKVKLIDIKSKLPYVDLVKMDVEGHEKEILLGTGAADWKNTDLLVEIGTAENAKSVYDHFSSDIQSGAIKLFSQKTGWNRVTSLDDMPTSYKEGTLFLTSTQEMPWGT